MEPVPDTRFVHRHASGGTMCLVEPDVLDGEMARHGLQPVTPTERVDREDGDSRRITANGHFVKKRR